MCDSLGLRSFRNVATEAVFEAVGFLKLEDAFILKAIE